MIRFLQLFWFWFWFWSHRAKFISRVGRKPILGGNWFWFWFYRAGQPHSSQCFFWPTTNSTEKHARETGRHFLQNNISSQNIIWTLTSFHSTKLSKDLYFMYPLKFKKTCWHRVSPKNLEDRRGDHSLQNPHHKGSDKTRTSEITSDNIPTLTRQQNYIWES